LFLEDVNEYTYRVDETLMNLMHAGAFDACAGVLLGEFTDCTAADPTYALTLDEIFSELLLPLGKPVLGGIRAGHCNPKITIPLGVAAEMDAGRQTLPRGKKQGGSSVKTPGTSRGSPKGKANKPARSERKEAERLPG